jgi:hypothetical protein
MDEAELLRDFGRENERIGELVVERLFIRHLTALLARS